MLLLTSLLIAHFVADFYLQPHAWIMDKVQYREKSFGLFKHICVHVVLTFSAIILSIATLSWEVWLGFAFIILSHYAIDIWKTYQSFQIKYFLIDQIGHYVVITGVTMWWLSLDSLTFHFPSFWFEAETWLAILASVLGFIFLYKPVALTQILVLNALNLDDKPYYQFETRSIFRRGLVFVFSITLSVLFIIAETVIQLLESYYEYKQKNDVTLLRKRIAVIVFNTFCVALAYIYFKEVAV
jgi:hypothetical protein